MKKIFLFIYLLCPNLVFSQVQVCDSLMDFIILDDNIHAKKIIPSMDFDVNCLSKFGDSPLMLASRRGNLEIVKCLLKKGASPNLIKKDGRTALFDAAFIYEQELESNLSMKPTYKRYDYLIKDKIVKLLIEYGANIHHIDSCKTNVLMVACMANRYEMVKLFVKNGIDINTQNDYGSTALMYAVFKEDYAITKFLLDSGASKSLNDNKGKTALDIAKEIQNNKIISLIEKCEQH
jgi:ankyrin repeat protein